MQFRKWLLILLAVGTVAPLVASAHSTQMPEEIIQAQTGGFGPPVLDRPVDGGFSRYGNPSFEWNTSVGALSYQLQLSTSASFTTGVQTFAVPNRTYFSTSTSQPDGIYYWRMRAYNGTLYSDWSEQRQFEIDSVKPVAPVLLAPAAGSTFTGPLPTFSWEPVSDAVFYDLSVTNAYGSGAGFYARLYPPITSFTPRSDLYLYPQDFSWSVVAVDAAGHRSTGNIVWDFTLVSLSDAAPNLYRYGLDTERKVLLRWGAIDGASVYHIQVAGDPDFSQLVQENNTLTVPEITYNLPSAVYYWRVRAGQGNGLWGPWSATSTLAVNWTNYFTVTPTASPTEWPTPTFTLTPSPTFTPTAILTPTPTATLGG